MEQDDTDQGMTDLGPGDGRPAGEQRRAGKDIGVQVGGVDIEHADILNEYDVTQAGDDGGEDDRLDPDQTGIEAEGLHSVAAETDGGEVSAEAGMQGIVDDQSHETDNEQHEQRHLDFPEAQDPDGVEQVPEAIEIDHVADADSPGQHHLGVAGGDDGAVADHEYQLIHTGGEEADQDGGDHLPSPGPVQAEPDHITQQDGESDSDDHDQRQAFQPAQLIVDGQDQADLGADGTDDDGEIETHAGGDRNDQGQDHDAVADEAGDDLVADEDRSHP